MSAGPVDPRTLQSLALSRPGEALRTARDVLAGDPNEDLAVVAHQTVGVVLRHFGAIEESVRELQVARRLARRLARRTGDDARVADVGASLGVALAMSGRTAPGLRALDEAVTLSRGVARGRVLIRRAHVHWLGAEYRAALQDARQAVRLLAADDDEWRARAVNHRAMMHLALGDAVRADRDYARSEELFTAAGQQFEQAYARMERGLAAHARGDLPRALRLFDQTAVLFAEQHVVEPDLAAARARVLVSAGLSRDALAVADEALAHLSATGGAPATRAVLLELAGQAAMADGDPGTAAERARAAQRLYRRQGNQTGSDRARLAALTPEAEALLAGPPGSAPPRRSQARVAGALADRLAGHDPDLAARGHLLAGRIELALGRGAAAERALATAAATAGRTTPGRSTAWLARALARHARGDHVATLRACAAGLRVIETHLRSLGALELRSVTTGQGSALADLAVRSARQQGRPEQVLTWVERWRSVALAVPAVHPDDDGQLVADLTALRMVTRRLAEVDSAPLLRERRRLEDAVRARINALAGPGGHAPRPATGREVAAAVAAAGDLELVELFLADGDLHAVHVRDGRIGLHPVGPHTEASRVLEHALFLLRREGDLRGRPSMDLRSVGLRLQRALLGGVADLLGAGEVVVVPPGPLHSVPWTLMPALQERVVTVAPSATTWRRVRVDRAGDGVAGADGTGRPRRVVLVAGPDLPGGAAEVAALARHYPDAVVLTGAGATSQAVLGQMDGADLVHLAAHGTFRADSPMFSSIELSDGPLTGYDLERLRSAPRRMLLSSCSSAVGAPTGADELLGVVSSLVARGCVGVVASVVPVSDPGTVPLMLALHEHLAAGAGLPTALHAAVRQCLDGAAGSLSVAAAQSFIALGA